MYLYSKFYSDGEFKSATGAIHLDVVNPSTGQKIADVATCSSIDVEQAVQSARRGFEVWSKSSVAERRRVLYELRDQITAAADRAVLLLAQEMGCPVWLGKNMQLPMALKGLELAAEGLDQIKWQEKIGNGIVEKVPCGVVVAITPWNFPFHQIVAKVAAAIAAGCAVVLKPSEVAPGAAQVFMEAVNAAGIPAGVVNLVWGGPAVGEQLVTHPLVDRISFTGSTQVGRRIMASAAEGIKPVTLELGGKSAAILLDDADIEKSVASVTRLSLANSGQACVSQSRLIAPRHRVTDIIDHWRACASQWPLGNPTDETTRLGPVATSMQHARVLGMIEFAQNRGAALVAGGIDRPVSLNQGFYVQPTLLANVSQDMEIAQEEIFGPVLAIMPYDTEDQAIDIANSTRYGLSGAVWSRDAEHALAVARRMKTGQVVINGATQNLATPFGGCGWSGFGRENGRFGIEEMLNYRSLHSA
ncbi:aldehyde dehydrogenase family protein [Advenella mimigardefordensis]|uniref:Putative aldehyde dehydrogenase n=1 Tax=Advenella mimigardefordensis (strain DSM 17166 / LMG 22922 / DPN7) TaxID=1247726 RepID=W0PAH1_ADVMD|nr:aldehyde dehydrogenase family protein [Advenella mimigardefordensis]AHG63844.1 putative aldehyde dehydrogenase [Advenella mimigardefordensis DPN7]